ncbi:glutathione S-transferase kappa 1 [Cladorrhinum sp. PSN332]|nr:glutathione S-transferase kappa 1 [Cladorrhinum sp. PSN332]
MAGGGKIDCYFDVASLYSYLVVLDLLRNRSLLDAHNVRVEFHPVLLGAINAGSGNRPPWTLPAKATYGIFDANRSVARFPGLQIKFPDDLMTLGHTVLPQRCLHFIKSNYPAPALEATILHLLKLFWSPPENVNLTVAENVRKALLGVKVDGKAVFSENQVGEILQKAGEKEMKDKLKNTTQEALDKGAFGAPWLWVTNSEGKGEPFFGSDRFAFVYRYLGVPFQDVQLLPPSDGKAKL